MKTLLFIQGGGDGGYEADKKIANALQKALGKDFAIRYPQLKTDESKPDFGWLRQIGDEIHRLNDGFVLAGHSLGASMLLKFCSEHKLTKKPVGIFLLATPFWSGDEHWKRGLKLQEDFAGKLPQGLPIFFYHCRDDKEVPFDHLACYKKRVGRAIFREIETGGHMFDDALSELESDIRGL